MMYGPGSGWPGMMAWMWVSWVLLIVGIVLLVVLLVRLAGSRGATPGTGASGSVPGTGEGSARIILDERYARGDISTAEYRERLEALRHDRP